MDEYKSLSHTTWDCKYHAVFIPKCRRKAFYGELRRYLGEVSGRLRSRGNRIEEGHLMPDHVHMMLSIPPKYSVSQVVGYIKGKSAIHMARVYGGANAISWDSISGPGDSSSTRSGATKKPSARTSAIKRKKIEAGAVNLWR